MDIEKIRELRLAYPFKPFRLVMEDGRKFLVGKPYHLGMHVARRSQLYPTNNGGFVLLRAGQVKEADRVMPPTAKDVEMTIEQLRAYYTAKPFQPFVIHLADGRSLRVDHPENVAMCKSGRTVGVVNEDDAIETIDWLLVTSLRPANGHGARRKKER